MALYRDILMLLTSYGSVLDCDWSIADHEAHAHFADDSAC
jgi:hypothetical protein